MCQQPKTPEKYFCKDTQCSYPSTKKSKIARHEEKKHFGKRIECQYLAMDIENYKYLIKKFKASEEKNIMDYNNINKILANRPGI